MKYIIHISLDTSDTDNLVVETPGDYSDTYALLLCAMNKDEELRQVVMQAAQEYPDMAGIFVETRHASSPRP